MHALFTQNDVLSSNIIIVFIRVICEICSFRKEQKKLVKRVNIFKIKMPNHSYLPSFLTLVLAVE